MWLIAFHSGAFAAAIFVAGDELLLLRGAPPSSLRAVLRR